MELIWIIYFIDTGIQAPSNIWGVLSVIMTIAAVAFSANSALYDSDAEHSCYYKGKRWPVPSLKPWAVAWCALAVISILMPSKDTAYKMLAAYGVTEVAKTEDARRLAGKSLVVLEKAMDNYMQDQNKGKE